MSKLTLVEKIIKAHTNDELIRGNTIKIKIDQTLTQDATGTMAYLEFLSMGLDKVKTELSVSYVDHNTLQSGFMNMDDHLFLQSVARQKGVVFSKPGNGICHQVHLENFAKPGKTLLGSDSHTPTSSAIGMLAIGAGGLDVACAMAGLPFSMVMPKVVNVELVGKLRAGVSAKDIILKLLSILTVKGGVNKVIEYTGEGVKSLNVPERATITNMGAELGATSSVFPSDERTLEYLTLQHREQDYIPLSADEGAIYDEHIVINLNELEPLVACPSQPDQVKSVKEVGPIKVDQVLIGSCTNSSYYDFVKVASILKGKKVADSVSVGIAPGSRTVLRMITQNGILDTLLEAGCRILETTCGPCIGMGQSPNTNAVSLRTFNRNFYGRSGTESASVYLVSPEIAAISALNGYLSSPLGQELDKFPIPESFIVDKNLIIEPTFDGDIIMGPNIKPIPHFEPVPRHFECKTIISLEDNISTDHIMPAGAKVLPYRSNIEKISEFCFYQVDKDFRNRCVEYGGGVIVAKDNYGQGSSREHAAIAPRYLGIKAVIAKSFARIHKKNLINFGILPIEADMNANVLDEIVVDINESYTSATLTNKTSGQVVVAPLSFNEEEKTLLSKGGLLNVLDK
ncbi:MAG: aconitate hydratase [Bacilli bacterium]|nr:aconitate hydratase [Bacilli bacterium]